MPTVEELAGTTLGRMERHSVKNEIKRAGEILRAGEEVQMIAVGQYKGVGNSLLIVTDVRLVIINEVGAFAKKLQQHDISWDRVSHVSSEVGNLGKIEINATGGDIEIAKILPGKRAGEIAEYIRTRAGTRAAPAAGPDTADQLRKLAELHASGVITDDEFNAKKAELLARM